MKQTNQKKIEGLRQIRRADLLLIAGVIALSLLLIGRNLSAAGGRGGALLQITVGGADYGTWPLDEDRIIPIGKTNVCEIRGGQVRMTHADCPDQICLHMRAIDAGGGSIVCLPNRVVLKIVRTGEREEREIDAVAR